ncbi:hypothetical protein F4819DRAFT_334096 [Hypoxylon fuscum]|nr:hypothetical protein F4819DRAFT_334096 [Hypoxylon fuscum]
MTIEQLHRWGRRLTGNRKKGHEFSPEARAFMVMAEAMGCTPQTVTNQINRFKEQHNFESRRPRKSSRPRLMSGRESARLRKLLRSETPMAYRQMRKRARLSIHDNPNQRWTLREDLRKEHAM